MALWVILGLDLMSSHHRIENRITKNFLSQSSCGNRWELLIKNFRTEREREREVNIYFWKLTKYFVSSFTWERSWLGSDVKPSQIRYNLVILRMFEIQAALRWIYILFDPSSPIQYPNSPSSQPFLYFPSRMPEAILHIFHMSEVTYWHRKTSGTVEERRGL